jgi:RNA-directed DNA polymerase
MAGAARSNYPDPTPRIDNVRRLQRKLWAAAKQSPERRFHALFDRICRGDVLVGAWERVRANEGAAGVDRQTLQQVQEYGVDRMLRELSQDLREGRYRPAPARRVEIPK